MARDSQPPTLRELQIPVALLVGGNDAMLHIVSEACLDAQALVTSCTVDDAPTTAASMRPLVMVLPEEVYASDPEGFDALARDVRAGLMKLPQEPGDREAVAAELTQLMNAAEEKRDSWPAEVGD